MDFLQNNFGPKIFKNSYAINHKTKRRTKHQIYWGRTELFNCTEPSPIFPTTSQMNASISNASTNNVKARRNAKPPNLYYRRKEMNSLLKIRIENANGLKFLRFLPVPAQVKISKISLINLQYSPQRISLSSENQNDPSSWVQTDYFQGINSKVYNTGSFTVSSFYLPPKHKITGQHFSFVLWKTDLLSEGTSVTKHTA